ncbi:MAG: hypothetical protein AAFP97_04220 [Pseudomonadota bacterium]
MADSGLNATSALRIQIQIVSDTTIRQTEMTAFQNTVLVCEANPVFCEPQVPSDDIIAERDKIAALFRLRLNALDQLNKAYDALKREAEYDASADLSGAMNNLTSSVNTYIDAASTAAPAASLTTRAFGQIATNVSSIVARRNQAQRLEEANLIIGEAAAALSDALKAEKSVYVAFLQDWANRENEVRAILIKNGVTSRASVLASLADAVGAPLSGDAEKTISKSDLLKASVEAVALSQTHRRRVIAEGTYNAAIRGLDQLSNAHRRFSEFSPSDLDRVNLALAELNAYADQLNEFRAARAADENGG